MSQKAEKPSLSGQRLKTRKRDEKEKYDPTSFRDAIVLGLNETGADLEQVSKYLDITGAKLNYRRYAEELFDILFAGGLLAPGGTIIEDKDPDSTKATRTNVCVFCCEEDTKSLKAFYEVFSKLLRRYKYLERSFEETLKKILMFTRGFKNEDKTKLAKITGIILANGFCTPKCLQGLFEDNLVKEGISLEFSTLMFRTWLEEKDVNAVFAALKKSQMDLRLLELYPLNKRSYDAFVVHFEKEGLPQMANILKAQKNQENRKYLQKELAEMVKTEETPNEIKAFLLEQMQKNGLGEQETTILVWNTIMDCVEWNKKEELVAEQALRHLKAYGQLLSAIAKTPKSELALLVKIQEYCYDNMAFMKVFQKIVVILYKMDVLSEDVILKWYKEAHSTKGKSVFLEQMSKFVEWLENAEEESEEDDD
ncbi:basic leucine zipper and W2 domain-containing protein 1-like [Pecten maximus]|uniref:basic leucine zipper and W2 domain-containing protein 1-like n=1 Tax=Pecten maximus TaxID=6579 RepID=UPI001458787E|nr:basic leucine zipper and W2 domain-containing protein 1-like [Pecten maximus]XP_033732882.1 basic leucine zipper and W2 domain-containing protein 1-like [Pecten maximus]